MNKSNGKPLKSSLKKAHHTTAPSALRLRVAMKRARQWPVPLAQMAAKATSGAGGRIMRIESQRVELSLIRSVAQASLRRGASMWGR